MGCRGTPLPPPIRLPCSVLAIPTFTPNSYGCLALPFLADSGHLGRVPGVEFGLSINSLAMAALGNNARGLVQGLAERLLHGCTDGAGLAFHLALEPPDDGALAFDGPAHALELPDVGVALGLAVEVLAFLGKRLFQIDARVLGRLHQVGPGDLQQAAVGGVSDRLFLDCAVHDHAVQLLRLISQQLLHTFFAQQLAELDQRGSVSRLAIFVIGTAREELPARHNALVRLVESVFEVQQRNHDAQQQARASCVAGHWCTSHMFAKEMR